MRLNMATAKVVRNGDPDGYDIRYGPIEKAIAAVVLSLLTAAVVNGVALYREVGVLQERLAADSKRLDAMIYRLDEHTALPFHLGVYQHFLPRDEFRSWVEAHTRANGGIE